MRNCRKLKRHFLRPEPALRAEKDHLGPWIPLPAAAEFNRLKQRLRHQNHAFAAPIRTVIHSSMTVRGEIAQVYDPNLKNPRLQGAPHDPTLQNAVEQLWENGDDIKSHTRMPRKIGGK